MSRASPTDEGSCKRHRRLCGLWRRVLPDRRYLPRSFAGEKDSAEGIAVGSSSERSFRKNAQGLPYLCYSVENFGEVLSLMSLMPGISLTKPVSGICCSLLLMSALSAAVAAPPSGPAVTVAGGGQEKPGQSEKAAAAYLTGVSLVYRDRRLETAIDNLREAVRLDAKNPEYRLALGCALVRRGASLKNASAKAVSYATATASYGKRYAAWERAQTDKTSPFYLDAPPAPPVPPTTRDDNKPFTLTLEQVTQRLRELSEQALTEWDAALAAARTDEERAHIHYVRGWGRILIQDYRMAPASSPASPMDAEKEFQAAIELAPNTALYWQSLGDSHIVLVGDARQESNKKAIAAYEKALKLDRRSAGLWFATYRLQQRNGDKTALETLQKAAAANPSDAIYSYFLADLYLKRYAAKAKTTTKTVARNETESDPDPDLAAGIAALERGNKGLFRPLPYATAIPKILAPLYPVESGANLLIEDFVLLVPIHTGMGVKTYLATGDTAGAMSAAQASVTFSDRILEFTRTQPVRYLDSLLWQFSMSAIGTSYRSQIEALTASGDSVGAANVQAKMEELTTQTRKKALRFAEEYKQSKN
jgi:tetratricopeptide (TPR) repeat protein